MIGAAAASGIPAVPVISQVVSPVVSPVISSQRAIIPQISSYGYGNGISSRYFDKADYGYGLGSYGLALGGIRTIAPAYYGAAGNLYGLGYNGLYAGRQFGLGYGLGNLGYGYGGVLA